MSKPLVSVIIPVFNREEFVEEAVQSILNQTIQDFEILIVDDCSSDNSVAIIENIKDSRIKLFKNDRHKGVSISRNIAIENVKGKYIAFMDSDDISHPKRFEKQIGFLESNPHVKACGCWLQCFGQDNHIIRHKENYERIKAELLLHNPLSLGATTVVRECFQKYKFNPEKLHVEDYDYWVQAAWDCELANLQEVLYDYRTHKKQVSSEFLKIQREQDIDIKLELFKKIDSDLIEKFQPEIIRVLFFKNAEKPKDYKKILRLLDQLLQINFGKKIYDQEELKIIFDLIKSKLIFEVFFLNKNELNFSKRLKILTSLSFMDQFKILKRKLI